MRRILSVLALSFWIATVITGCNRSISEAQASQKTNKGKINWFVDKAGKPLPSGYVNWEAEKQQRHISTDLLIIHHTAAPSGITWQQLSETERDRLYIPRYASTDPDPLVKGLKPHSGHYRIFQGKKVEVFYAYHWLIRADGTALRLLEDNEVAWNCNDWGKNMRSVAICFDGDFSNSKPSTAALTTAGKLIRDYKRRFKIKEVVGHKDVSSTACPGEWWLVGKQILLGSKSRSTVPQSEKVSAGTYKTTFLSDVNYPDGSTVKPGQIVEKKWQVLNSGTRDWKGLFLQPVGSSAIQSKNRTSVPDTPAGQLAIWKVTLTMPNTPGQHRASFKLVDATGRQVLPNQSPVYILVTVE